MNQSAIGAVDYRALVRVYYPFAIPGPVYEVQCGGNYISLEKPR